MIAKRDNAQQHDLHANPAENAGGYSSDTTSGRSWRRLGWFIAATVFASFVLNEIWEMAQMSAYVETAGYPWKSTLGRCTRAAVGDIGIILGIYLTTALVAGGLFWGLRVRSWVFAATAVAGLAYAVLVENLGLSAGRWSYTEHMPVVPMIGVGLWPILQMTLLPPLVFVFAKFWIARTSSENGKRFVEDCRNKH
jgi:hypothetical protein